MSEIIHNAQIGNGGYRKSEDINVPAIFSEIDGIGKELFLKKGQFNIVEMRPEIINEQNSSDRSIQSVINSTTIVGQSFKASNDNINGISLVMEPAEAGVSHENFESYADSAALRLVWPQIGPGPDADLEQVIVSPNFGSTKSMKLTLDNVLNDWANTGTAIDVSNSVIAIDWLQTDEYARLKTELYMSDGVNTVSADIVSSVVNVWETFIWDSIDFQPELSNQGPIDLANIITFGFRVLESRQNRFGYADNMILLTQPGSIIAKLWDFGTNPPEGGTDSIDSGTQYTTLGDPGIGEGTLVSQVSIPIQSDKALYFVNDFIAGPAFELDSNEPLTPNNYYVITLNYVDTDINVYGTDPAEAEDRYINGFAFTSPDESSPITAVGPFNDIFFNIFSVDDILLESGLFAARSADEIATNPGDESIFSLYVIDRNFKIVSWIAKHENLKSIIDLVSSFRVVSMEKGGKVAFVLNDDAGDNVSSVSIKYSYFFKSPTVNG